MLEKNLKNLESKIDSIIEILSQFKDRWCKKHYTTREGKVYSKHLPQTLSKEVNDKLNFNFN